MDGNKEKPFNPLPTSSSSSQHAAKRRKPPSSSSDQASKRRKKEPVDEVSKRRKNEQAAAIRDIKRKKNYYKILGVEKNSSAEDIRKAYRKLSLKVHPDKNRVPGAEDSFKKLLEAFECLSNDETWKRYDLQTSPASRRRSSSSKVSVSRSSSSGVEVPVISKVVVHLIFGVGAFFLYMLYHPFSMEELMMVARDRATVRFKLTGSFRLKYEYEGRLIYLPKEDELGADDELRTCVHRLLSVGKEPIVIRAIFDLPT